jgi:hypothetical protein
VIQRQFARDDFDENVLASTEAIALLLQLHPMFISQLLNLLLRFCANARHIGSAGHNAFNLVSMIGTDAKGNEALAELKVLRSSAMLVFFGGDCRARHSHAGRGHGGIADLFRTICRRERTEKTV